MVMCASMGDALRERLPALWRRIENAHYSYLETDDSPEKLRQRSKLDGYITEYLSIVPHDCKFGLSETGKVFQKSINELPDWSAYRAGLGWAALARYANNLLAQPWRKEYKVIRLYSGYYKHEVEANMAGAELMLLAMGYKPIGGGRAALLAPACPDMVAAVSRDAAIAQAECRIMAQIWELVWGSGARTTWAAIARERATHAASAPAAAARLAHADPAAIGLHGAQEIYSNIPVPVTAYNRPETRYNVSPTMEETAEDNMAHMNQTYVVPNVIPPHVLYPIPTVSDGVIPNPVPMMTSYGMPYYYPVQRPYMMPTPVYSPIKQATNVPVNGYPVHYARYPPVPTAQLIELDAPSSALYENGKYREDDRYRRKHGESSRKESTKSNLSDISSGSLIRSDTQPALSKAREDGMGTYESWDYVFRNLSSKDQNDRTRYSPSLDRDSRTLDRYDREERRSRYTPTTLDLEDGMRVMNLDRSHDEDTYRTAKVNENLMKLKQEQERKARAKKVETKKKVEPGIAVVKAEALVTPKVAPDKVKLLSKKEIKDRKDVIRQQSMNGAAPPSAQEARKVKKPAKLVGEVEKAKKPLENGHTSKGKTSQPNPSYDIKAQLVVSLDENDSKRPQLSPKQNGERVSTAVATETIGYHRKNSWQCHTCTYLNATSLQACEMCGKSRSGPIQPLLSGGRECPACTLVNKREAKCCDACGTSLEHCPTYI